MASKQRAIAELTADDSGFQKGMARAEKRLGTFRKLSEQAGKALASVGTKALAGLAGGAALGGTALFVNEAKKTFDFERDLTRLGITARGAMGPLDGVRKKIFDVSSATGVAREDVLHAAAAFVALTGNGKVASDSLELFARVNKATGSSMDDIASSAAALTQNLKIDPAQLEQAFSILISQGKAGAVELKDMAGLFASLAPLAANFAGGSGVGGLANIGAALQLTRQGFGSAQEAATGLEALMGGLVKHADRFKAGGVNIFTQDKDGTKHLKGFQEIIESIGQSKLAKDPQRLVKALGTKEAYQAFLQLVKVKGAWSDLATSTAHADDLAKDYATYQQSAAGQIEQGWNAVKNSVAQTFTPEVIGGFVLALKDALKFIQDMIIGLKGIGEELDYLTGGKASKVGKMEGDDALEKALKAGYTLDQIEAIKKAPKKVGAFGSQPGFQQELDLQRVAGVDDPKQLYGAAARRRGQNAAIAKTDFERFSASPTLLERQANAGAYQVDATRADQPTEFRVYMDPSTTDLRGKMDNSQGLTRR